MGNCKEYPEQPAKKSGWAKVVVPILLAVVISIFSTGAGLIAKHEGDIRRLHRVVERTNVDRYRRILGHYRAHYRWNKACVTRNKRIVRALPEDSAVRDVAIDRVDQCSGDKDTWRALIENYVEENKHMGFD